MPTHRDSKAAQTKNAIINRGRVTPFMLSEVNHVDKIDGEHENMMQPSGHKGRVVLWFQNLEEATRQWIRDINMGRGKETAGGKHERVVCEVSGRAKRAGGESSAA